MGLLDIFFKKTNKDLRGIVQQSALGAVKRAALISGRSTKDSLSTNSFWYQGIIKRNDLRNQDIIEKLKVIVDISPDASMAVWNILRLANNGHELEAMTVNGKVEKATTDKLNQLAARVGRLYGGGTDQLINVLLLTAFTQGAIALEVELNEDLSDVVDFHAIDPFSLEYRKNKDTGDLELVQQQSNGEYKVMNQEQVFYYPVDPSISDPYGRSPILPVLQVVFFQAEVLKDLRAVIRHQGYERFDISVVEEAIMNNMPEHIKSGGEEAISSYVSSYIADVQAQMNELEPDDDFFHTDSVKVDTVGGAKGSMDASKVIDVINQQIVTSLKQLPILLGRNEGTTETHGTIQWQIYVSGIQSIQRAIKRVMEKAYNVALQIYGKPLRASLEFNPLQMNDRLKEAQAELQETNVKIAQVNQGWIDNNEAANDIVGHDAVAEPKQQVSTTIPMKANANDQQGQDQQNQDNNQDNPQAARYLKVYSKKKRSEFGRALGNGEDWAEDLEGMVKNAERAYFKLLKKQRDLYIKRIKDAPEIPTRILADIASFRSFRRDDVPSPTPEFENWVDIHIIKDSPDQINMWEEMNTDWIEQALYMVGSASLQQLVTGMDFHLEDRTLLRWLSDRSRRSAELIQGVTDEDVLMTLWDVAYEGNYSIKKFSEAIQDSFAFSESRGNTIARTEVITAGRSGQYFADVQSGIVIGKKWRSAAQERTREGHREANNQIVKLQDPFFVANGKGQLEPLLFPGDTSLGASGSNVINCRCHYQRILEGEEDLLK